MFKLPTIEFLIDKVIKTLKRFPLSILCAFVGTGILIYLTHIHWMDWHNNNRHYFTLEKILMCSELGLCLFFAADLFLETKQHSLAKKIILHSLIIAFLVVYYFTLLSFKTFSPVNITRYSLYIIAAHLLVSFAPFIGKNKINGFWQFNKTLFLKLLTAFLYTIVLYVGISVAFFAIDELLKIEISYRVYLCLWYFLAGIFNTCYFLTMIPENLETLDKETDYPKGLKSFTQFVLLPLVTLYLVILYIYFIKIIALWSLPKGYVSYLITSFSIMGIFSLLLIYPIRNNSENKWIKLFSKGFYFALYPLIVLLVIAIYHRISEYGVTADRYFILVLATWLVCMATYFLFSQKENIKIIPISLFMIAVLSSFGPWGAFSISIHSQKNRLEKILILNHILVNGKIKKSNYIDTQDYYKIQSIVSYLNDKDALDVIHPWFNSKLDSVLEKKNINRNSYYDYWKTDTILEYMGVYQSQYAYNYRNDIYGNNNKKIRTINFNAEQQNPNFINVTGFDYSSTFNTYNLSADSGFAEAKTNFFIAGTDSFHIQKTSTLLHYEITSHNKVIASFDLNDFLKNLKNSAHFDSTAINGYVKIPNEKFVFDVQSDSILFHFLFNELNVTDENKKITVISVNATILTKKLKKGKHDE